MSSPQDTAGVSMSFKVLCGLRPDVRSCWSHACTIHAGTWRGLQCGHEVPHGSGVTDLSLPATAGGHPEVSAFVARYILNLRVLLPGAHS